MNRILNLRVLGAALLLLSAAGLAMVGQPDLEDKWAYLAPEYESRLTHREVFIDPAELLHLMNDDYIELIIYDVRDERDWNIFHLVDAERIPLEALPTQRKRLRALLGAGVTFFLDLTEAGEKGLRPYDPTLRQEAGATGREVEYRRVPIPDFDTPSAGQMRELLDALDSYIPAPEREVDKPFLMCIEDVFSISGRGTVGTGRIECGIVKTGEEIEITYHLRSFARDHHEWTVHTQASRAVRGIGNISAEMEGKSRELETLCDASAAR